MSKTLPEEVGKDVLEFGKNVFKEVIKSGEGIVGFEAKEEGKSAIIEEIKKILPKNPLE